LPFLPATSSSVDTVQNLNASGTVTAWGSVVLIGVTPLTANATITLPAVTGNLGKTIRFVRVDSAAFTVTLAPFAGDTLTLISAGTELATQSGSITVQAVATTGARQVAQVAAAGTGTALHYASFIAESGSALGGNAGALVLTSTTSTTASVVPPTTARLPLATGGGLTVTASVSGPTVSGNQIIIAATGRYSINGYSQQRGNSGATTNNNEVVQIIVNGAIVATFASRDIDGSVVGKTLPISWAGNLTAGDAVDFRIRRGGAGDVDLNRYTIVLQQEPTSVVVPAGSLTPTTLSYLSVSKSTVTTGNPTDILFDTVLASIGAGITYNPATGVATLAAGKTYRLSCSLRQDSSAASTMYSFVDSANASLGGPQGSATSSNAGFGDGDISFLYTPVATTNIKVRTSGATGSLSANAQWMTIEELPTSTVVAPGTITPTSLAYFSTGYIGTAWAAAFVLPASTGGTANPTVPNLTAVVPFNSANFTAGTNVGGFTTSATGITVPIAGTYSLTYKSDVNTSATGQGAQLIIGGTVVDFGKFNENPNSANTDGQLTLRYFGTIAAGALVQVAHIRESAAGTDTLATARMVIEQVPALVVVAENALPAYPVTTKTANYTTLAADFGGYIRFTAGVPTLHAPAAGNVGQQIVIRNATASQFTCVAGAGATIAGSLVVAPAECIAFIATGAGTYDAVGGI
jgi:hypothetical protein